MKKILSIVALSAATLGLTGCVVTPSYVSTAPVYYSPAPVYVAPRPVYVAPRPVYITPVCYNQRQWNSYYRMYQNVRVCR
jgi:hypothetical protein